MLYIFTQSRVLMQNLFAMQEEKNNEIIIAAVDDIIFGAKIKGTAGTHGINVTMVRSTQKFIETLTKITPTKIIVDLHSEKCDPFLIAEKVKEDERLKNTKLIGFFSHVYTELMKKALAAGYDEVLPRSAFTKKLPQILRD